MMFETTPSKTGDNDQSVIHSGQCGSLHLVTFPHDQAINDARY